MTASVRGVALPARRVALIAAALITLGVCASCTGDSRAADRSTTVSTTASGAAPRSGPAEIWSAASGWTVVPALPVRSAARRVWTDTSAVRVPLGTSGDLLDLVGDTVTLRASSDGRSTWSTPLPPGPPVSPTLWPVAGAVGALRAAGTSSRLDVLDARTGRIRFSRTGAAAGIPFQVTQALMGVPVAERGGTGLDVVRSTTGTRSWSRPGVSDCRPFPGVLLCLGSSSLDLVALDPASGRVRWQVRADSAFAAVVGGRVFVRGRSDTVLKSYDARTGTPGFSVPIGTAGSYPQLVGPLDSGHVVYAELEQGTVGAVESLSTVDVRTGQVRYFVRDLEGRDGTQTSDGGVVLVRDALGAVSLVISDPNGDLSVRDAAAHPRGQVAKACASGHPSVVGDTVFCDADGRAIGYALPELQKRLELPAAGTVTVTDTRIRVASLDSSVVFGPAN